MIISPYIIPLFFGDGFSNSIDILIWLSLCIPLRFLSSSVGGCLVTKNNMGRKVVYQGGVAIVNLVLNFLLIPTYYAYGAVISTVFSEFVLLILYLYGANRYVFNGGALKGWNLNWKTLSS